LILVVKFVVIFSFIVQCDQGCL